MNTDTKKREINMQTSINTKNDSHNDSHLAKFLDNFKQSLIDNYDYTSYKSLDFSSSEFDKEFQRIRKTTAGSNMKFYDMKFTISSRNYHAISVDYIHSRFRRAVIERIDRKLRESGLEFSLLNRFMSHNCIDYEQAIDNEFAQNGYTYAFCEDNFRALLEQSADARRLTYQHEIMIDDKLAYYVFLTH